jgi:transposase-like protein
MGETRRKFDRDFQEDAVRLVRETGRPIAQVARDLGINEGTLGNWVDADRRCRDGGEGQLSEDERAELMRLRRENAELTMERDVVKRSVAEMLGESLLPLATLAGRTTVEAAATDRWEPAERRYAKLLGQGNPKQTQLAERWLEDTREQLAGRPGADMELIRTALVARWAGRWANLLEENPDTEAELRALVREIQTGLPAGEPSMSNHVVSAGDAVSSHVAGPEHPGFLAAQSELAYSAGQAGDAAAARDQFTALLPVAERVLGPHHPDTLAARASLAYWTGQAGDAAAARDQFTALLPVAERVLGPEHPDILINRHNLANFTGYTGDAAAARDQFAALLRVRERVFGPDSPDTLVARFNLAYWTGCAGDAAAARDQFAALFPVRERIYGPDHVDTLAMRKELAFWTGCAGDAAAARDQFAALLLSYELVLSPEHAETLAVWYQLAHWTALAANDAAKQGIVTRPIGPQGVADADDEGDVVEEGEGGVVDESEGDSEGLGEIDGSGEEDFDVPGDGGGWNGDDT